MKWNNHDPLYDDMNLLKNKELKISERREKKKSYIYINGKRYMEMPKPHDIKEDLYLWCDDKQTLERIRKRLDNFNRGDLKTPDA